MMEWLTTLAALERDGEASVLVTVLAARGSTPREAGCKMVVARRGLVGTIGGGNLEFQCAAIAESLLDEGAAAPVLRDFPLGPALGQCCGGNVSVLFEPIRPAGLSIALFGAGHVGRALVRLLGGLACRVRWHDQRPDAFPAELPANVVRCVTEQPATEVMELPAASVVLVMTHDHQADFAIVAAALTRGDFAAIGLIGSQTKRARFAGRLRRMGLEAATIERLICPFGVPGVGGKRPEEVAISMAARILQLQTGQHDKTGGNRAVVPIKAARAPACLERMAAGNGTPACGLGSCADE